MAPTAFKPSNSRRLLALCHHVIQGDTSEILQLYNLFSSNPIFSRNLINTEFLYSFSIQSLTAGTPVNSSPKQNGDHPAWCSRGVDSPPPSSGHSHLYPAHDAGQVDYAVACHWLPGRCGQTNGLVCLCSTQRMYDFLVLRALESNMTQFIIMLLASL